ncbi:parkin coregulated gene protein homolog [Plutella xylostella]|uniref:parkin coregulated gene protein homolog n=1 Tax=Plutella xylostella TaxID=51655 RepID=UPI002032F163|nr:parkin coregulated gene protein homolog [Plutella xylostella]
MVVLPPCVPADCGKEFRHSLRKPSPNYPGSPTYPGAAGLAASGRQTDREPGRRAGRGGRRGAERGPPRREVPAFTVQALQRGTRVRPPPRAAPAPPPPADTAFKRLYTRNEFPAKIEAGIEGKRLVWKVPVEQLDYQHYLPLLLEGTAEGAEPYVYVIEQALADMVAAAPARVLGAVPRAVLPLRAALQSGRRAAVCHALRCLRLLLDAPRVGEALVPYYRQLLPVCRVLYNRGRDLGPGIDTNNKRGENEGDLVEETLQLLERRGGPDAFLNIKYIVPPYESAVLN